VASDSSKQVSFHGRAEPACLDHVHDLMTELWNLEPGVSLVDRELFATAVVEVANNIVEHGQGAGPTDLLLTVQVDADHIRAVFDDDGAPADVDIDAACLPDDLADSGRGLALARAAAGHLTYERIGALNRWQVVRQR
jgi:serine/threonine-protein kinase RsbW